MKCLTAWALIIAMTGCTTLRPITTDQANLPQRIATEELLKPGDHVVIKTKDRQTYEFDVTSSGAGSIDGKHQSIPIDQVVSIQKRELSGKKTALLFVSIVAGVALTVALVHAFQAAAAAAILNSSP